ncbi:hypothetical protein HSHS1_11330 [Helicobacter suis HS1]|nr:hypothetical protein HSHS1_11330 [Helicobacter suis HS1]
MYFLKSWYARPIVSMILLVWGWAGADNLQIQHLKEEYKRIEHQINSSNSIWLKKFSNAESYEEIYAEIQSVQRQLKTLNSKKDSDTLKINTLKHVLQALKHQEELLERYKMNPFKDLVEKPSIPNIPSITNPIAIVEGISFIKKIKAQYATMKSHQKSLQAILVLINHELNILTQLESQKEGEDASNREKLSKQIYQEQIKKIELQGAQNLLKISIDVFAKDIEEASSNILLTRFCILIKSKVLRLIATIFILRLILRFIKPRG